MARQSLISIFFSFLFIPSFHEIELPLNLIQLPKGFHISIYAHVPNARSLTLGTNGVVFVGNRSGDSVYALLPDKNFSAAKKVIVIASKLNSPNGVAFKNGHLYVAEIHRILKFPDIEKNLENPHYEVIYDKLPTSAHHGWRYIGIGPDNWLYIGIGAPCNVCVEKEPYQTISRLRLDGKDFQIYAKGIRNSVGFDWHPVTKQLWFTENGRDWLGDEIPPDELNFAPNKGMDFGFPYYYGNNVPDPSYGKMRSSEGMTIPALNLEAHVASLGMRFYTGKMFPKSYLNQIFIAEHGSWNRSKKIGYRIMLVKLNNNKVISHTVFASGWLQNETVWGRPVDVLVMPDGSLLVSDDYANVVYRITYQSVHETA